MFAVDGDPGAGNLLPPEPQGGARRKKCSKFVVAVLRCGQCVVRWWRGDGLNARESVGDNVVLSRYVSYIGGKLSDEIKVIELSVSICPASAGRRR
jgi:hypothetical protein